MAGTRRTSRKVGGGRGGGGGGGEGGGGGGGGGRGGRRISANWHGLFLISSIDPYKWQM